MRLLITAAVSVSGRTADLCLDLPEDSTVGDLARSLATHFGLHPGIHLDVTGTLPQEGGQGRHGLLGVASTLGDTGPAGTTRSQEGKGPTVSSSTGDAQRVPSPGGVIGLAAGDVRPADRSRRREHPAGQPPPTGTRQEKQPGSSPSVWLGERRLDVEDPVITCPIRNGDVVGVGGPVPDVLAEPDGIVEVRAASGPGAGRVLRLTAGEYSVGAAEDCALPLQDPTLPGICLWMTVDPRGQVTITPDSRAARTTRPPADPGRAENGPIVTTTDDEDLSEQHLVRRGAAAVRRVMQRENDHRATDPTPPRRLLVDPSADRPLIHLDRAPVTAPTRWCSGAPLVVGDSMLELSSPVKEDLVPLPGPREGVRCFDRPRRPPLPCYNTRFRMSGSVRGPSAGADDHEWPPGAGRSASAGGPVHRRRSLARQRREEERTQVEERVYRALAVERLARRKAAPDPGSVLLLATGPRERLWERRPDDPDWLLVRVGTADLDSEVELHVSEGEVAGQTLTWTTPDVPVCLSLAEAGTTGLFGPPQWRRSAACWIIAQIAALHAPDDVELMMLADSGSCSPWRWLRWLPHIRGHDENGPLIRIGTDPKSITRRLLELRQLIDVRTRARHESGGDRPYSPVVVLLDSAQRVLGLPEAHGLLDAGPSVGVLPICLDDDRDMIPRTGASAEWKGDRLHVHLPDGTGLVGVRPDEVGTSWCERLSRALSSLELRRENPLSDPIRSSSVPHDGPDADDVLRGWRENGRSARADLGSSSRGRVVIDLEKDGPHGLVAGTAGSGKSQVLRRLVRSLAVANRPENLALFFVGDSEIIAEFRDLPHTIGTVGISDTAEARRAMTALTALLRSRKEQTARPGAQSFEDPLASGAPTSAGEPRILIVVDDFTRFSEHLPDIAAELVRLARESRSSGVHFVLSTRYPIGVVGAGNAPYSNWRIALRVTDPAESEVVVDVQDAAGIPRHRPGRALLRKGHEEPVLFQTDRTAADHAGSVRLCSLAWERMGRSETLRELRNREAATFVERLREADRRLGSSRLPSLVSGELPERIALCDLPSIDAEDAEDPRVPPLPIGLVDLPEEGDRRVAYWDPGTGGNLLVAGSCGSGRSSTLWTLAASAASHCSSRDVHLYAIDSGEGALLPLARLPHVGAAVGKDEPERMGRLFEFLRQETERRTRILDERGLADITELRRGKHPEENMPYIVLLLDHWEGHVSAFSQIGGGSLIDPVIGLLQNGGRAGVRIVIAAGRGGVVGRLPSLVDEKIVLRMDNAGDYLAAGLPACRAPAAVPPGRGFSFRSGERNRTGSDVGRAPHTSAGRGEAAKETQIAMVTVEREAGSAVTELGRIADRAVERDLELLEEHRPSRIDPLPTVVTAEAISELRTRTSPTTSLSLGVGGNRLGLLRFDVVEHGPGLLVTGPAGAGRSTALIHLAREAVRSGWSPVVLAGDDSPLHGLETPFPVRRPTDEHVLPALREALGQSSGRRLVLIDDADQLRDDDLLGELAQWYASLGSARDAFVVSCPLDKLGEYRRNPLPSGGGGGAVLLLRPSAGEEIARAGIALPTDTTVSTRHDLLPPGRGLLLTRSGHHWLQVPQHQQTWGP